MSRLVAVASLFAVTAGIALEDYAQEHLLVVMFASTLLLLAGLLIGLAVEQEFNKATGGSDDRNRTDG